MRCDGSFVASSREVEPTADGWRNLEFTGNVSFSCSHGLTLTGPKEHLLPLVEAHRGFPSQGRQPTVLGRRTA